MIKVRLMKVIAIFTVIAGLFGCRAPGETPFILDGPGMVYVDSEHRTEYANTLPFDEIDDYPYWAVAYLGEGENGKNTAKEYIEKLFSKLSEGKRRAISHYDYGGEKWYLVIPRYGDENELIQNGDKKNSQKADDGTPYIINCGGDVEIYIVIRSGHKITLDTDENGRLICTPDIWDITEYKE